MKEIHSITKKYTIFALLLFLFLCRNISASIDSIAEGKVKIEDDSISIQVKDITLGKLLKEIEEKVEVEFKLKKSLLEKKVSVSFRELSLSEALKKIIYPLNYSIIRDENGKINKVFIIDQGDPRTIRLDLRGEPFKFKDDGPPDYVPSPKSDGGPPGLNNAPNKSKGK